MRLFLCVLVVLSAVACVKQSPQLPANKFMESDSVALAVQLVNQRLIAGEDSLLATYIEQHNLKLTKTASGLWYRMKVKGSGNKLADLDKCTIMYSMRTLTDSSLMSKTESVVIGKKQIINGIEELLLKMHRGDEVFAVIPWYLAYGMKGTNEIAPYSSLIVELKLYN